MLKRALQSAWMGLIRTFAFVGKELRIIFHQPRLVFSLILGPFLILLIFGVGYRDAPRSLRTLFVVPENSQVEDLVAEYTQDFGQAIDVAGTTSSAAEADGRLRAQEVDLVVVTPPDPMANWDNGEQATFALYHYEIDPIEAGYIQLVAQRYAEVVNERTLIQVVRRSQEEAQGWEEQARNARQEAAAVRQALAAGDEAQAEVAAGRLKSYLDVLAVGLGSSMALFSGLEGAPGAVPLADEIVTHLQTMQEDGDQVLTLLDSGTGPNLEEGQRQAAEIESSLTEVEGLVADFRERDARVLVAPFRSEVLSVTEAQPEAMHFYVPGVIALLLQHIAITLAGLSIIRETFTGAMELFRAAPVKPSEILFGKYIGFLLLIGLLAAVLTGLVIWGLQTPQLGTWVNYTLVILALLLASLGIGFHISLTARSDSQAIQFGMLTLLASIFFSGFFLPLYRLWQPAQVVSWLLPATYGTQMLQDVMLRGRPPQYLLLAALFLGSAVLYFLAWWRLRRQMARE